MRSIRDCANAHQLCEQQRRPHIRLTQTLAVLIAVLGPADQAVASHRAEPLFAAPFLSFDTGPGPSAVAIADLNADGHADLIVPNGGEASFWTLPETNTVAVLLGRGGGVFDPRILLGTDRGPASVAVADLNSDGRLDLAVANSRSNTVSILLGRGDGTFESERRVEVGEAPGGPPNSIIATDLNLDGRPDIVVVSADRSPGGAARKISVLLARGDVVFTPPVDLAAGDIGGVTVGDLDGNGHPDLVASMGWQGIAVFLGTGDGTFESSGYYTCGYATAAAVSDINGDGHDDVVVGNYGSQTLCVLMGVGDGTLRVSGEVPGVRNPADLEIRDFTGDGSPDVFVMNAGLGSGTLAPGNGDGTFGPVRVYRGIYGIDLDVGDLDGDGTPDVAVTGGRSAVHVFLNHGDGSFGALLTSFVGTEPTGLAVGDLNRDGRPDVATTCWKGGRVLVPLLGRGDGRFEPGVDVALEGTPRKLVAGDVDGNGTVDLVLGGTEGFPLRILGILPGNGDGTLGPLRMVGRGPYRDVAIAQVVPGPEPDLVALKGEWDPSILVFPGRPGGGFADSIQQWIGGDLQALAVGDLNGDGQLDAVVADYADALSDVGNLVVLLGDGSGTFRQMTAVPVASRPLAVAIGDLNRDGHPDVATASQNRPLASVLIGGGDGAFVTRTDVRTDLGVWAASVTITDVNNDQRPDLIVLNNDARTVSVLLGNGDGTLQPKLDFGAGVSPVALAVADVNLDGRQDIVLVDNAHGHVLVLANHGPFPQSRSVVFDIRPASCPNPLSLVSHGVLPAAILGTADLDVRTIDPASLRLEGTLAPLRWHVDDVGSPPGPGECSCSAAGPDGIPDLNLKFATSAVTLLPGHHGSGATRRLRVTGMLQDGSPLEGEDCVTLVGRIARSLLRPRPGHPNDAMREVTYMLEATQLVTLTVYDVSGRIVARLIEAQQSAGDHSAVWDTRSVPTGIYFMRLAVPTRTEILRMLVLR
uniref:T9SS type A sorting domain-containing protein n=1 Tax=Eiseniibacteriota bacterium TaxID=2212470 RepID=A0A832I2A7_UNCEI